VAALQRHAQLLAEHYGEEIKACRDIRKHVAWYLKGYVVGHRLRASLGLVETLEQLGELLGGLELDQPYPGEPAEGPRGRTAGAKRVALPEGWLEHRQLTGAALAGIREAELSVSGG
jgi:hypothetical protein